MDYNAFKEKTIHMLKKFFTVSDLRASYIEVFIQEAKEDFEIPEEMICLFNHVQEKQLPLSYSLFIAYETYRRCNDFDKAMQALAATFEKQYLENQEATMVKEETQNPVIKVNGDAEMSVAAVYVIEQDRNSFLYDHSALDELAQKEDADLLLLPIEDSAIMVVPTQTLEEYEDNLEVYQELCKTEMIPALETQVMFYSKSSNVLLEKMEEIGPWLEGKKKGRRGYFSKFSKVI